MIGEGQFGPQERLREPGLGSHWLGRERYVIAGNAVVAFPLLEGDHVELIDPEGLQCAHIAAVNARSELCTAQLGLTPNVDAGQISQLLSLDTSGAAKFRAKLKAIGVDLSGARAAQVLSGPTEAGSSIEFTSEADCIVLIAAPGADMEVDQQTPPTDLIAWVVRAQPQASVSHELPDPLADPRQDFRIKAASATSYVVEAGQYIQVIDVDGRQCSDFQCFDVKSLDQGVERCLDATATRTMVGSAYPAPGLYSKFFDVQLEPVVEVIQDTCGRHDSFGLACTAKHYEDMGYPGHANCSDNFNYALQQYPIARRNGWMAINLFFNTFFDDSFQLYSDEPWSRPGDYVLMRATKDLVCVTSSCTDDIDAANAWVPTDIHVRVYDHSELFKRSIAIRKTTDAEPVMTQETAFHSETSKLTRNYVESSGYWVPNCYTNQGAIEEYWACRENAVIVDLTPLRKYEVVGPDSELLLQRCLPRDIQKLSVGQVTYTAMCNPSGGMIDDGTLFRLGRDNFRWIGGCDGSGLWLRERNQEMKLKAWVKNATSQIANIQVQGPKSRDILSKVIWTRPDQATLEELGWFRFSVARIGDSTGIAVVVSRTGFTGELGYEVFCHPSHASQVWQAIMEAGKDESIKPMGMEALDILRIEAGLILAGNEFCEQTDPFEAGIGFSVPLKTKTDDFIGRDALKQRYLAPQRKLVGLELAGRELAGTGDGVYSGRYKVGEITSATFSPVLGKNIALCRMNVEYSEDGTELEIGKLDGHQKRIPVVVVPYPHFDPGKKRVRGQYPD